MGYDVNPEDRPADPIPLRAAMRVTGQTADYPFVGLGQPQGLMYVGLGLAGEAGEIANQIKKITRDDGGMVTTSRRDKLFDELGDVMWYWLRACAELGFDPDEVVQANQTKLARRQANGTLHGDTVNGHRVPAGLAGKRGEVVSTSLRQNAQRRLGLLGATPAEKWSSKESAALALIAVIEDVNGFTAYCRGRMCQLLGNAWSFSDHSEDAVNERAFDHCEKFHVAVMHRGE